MDMFGADILVVTGERRTLPSGSCSTEVCRIGACAQLTSSVANEVFVLPNPTSSVADAEFEAAKPRFGVG